MFTGAPPQILDVMVAGILDMIVPVALKTFAKEGIGYFMGPSLVIEDLDTQYHNNGDAHIRLRVKNVGNRPATNCTASWVLSGSSDNIELEEYRSILLWRGEQTQLTISPGESVEMVVAIVSEGEVGFLAETGLPPLYEFSGAVTGMPSFDKEVRSRCLGLDGSIPTSVFSMIKLEQSYINVYYDEGGVCATAVDVDLNERQQPILQVR